MKNSAVSDEQLANSASNDSIRDRYEKEGGPAIRHGLNGDHGMSFKEALAWVAAAVVILVVVIGRLV